MNFPQFTLGNKGCLENKHRWSSGFEWPPETSSNIADLCELSVIPMPPRWSKEHLCWIGSWHKSSKCPQISGCYPNTSVFVPPGFGFLVKAAPPPVSLYVLWRWKSPLMMSEYCLQLVVQVGYLRGWPRLGQARDLVVWTYEFVQSQVKARDWARKETDR